MGVFEAPGYKWFLFSYKYLLRCFQHLFHGSSFSMKQSKLQPCLCNNDHKFKIRKIRLGDVQLRVQKQLFSHPLVGTRGWCREGASISERSTVPPSLGWMVPLPSSSLSTLNCSALAKHIGEMEPLKEPALSMEKAIGNGATIHTTYLPGLWWGPNWVFRKGPAN